MGNLLSVDFYKIFKTKFFYIIGIVLSIFDVVSCVADVYSRLDNKSYYDLLGITSGSKGAIWTVVYSNINSLTLFLVILTVLFMCSEFSAGTIKNIATKGYPRESIYLSKFFVSISCAGVYLLLTIVVSFVSSLVVGGNKIPNYYSLPSNMFVPFLLVVFYLCVYISIALMITSFSRKSGNSLAIYVVTSMVTTFLPALLYKFFKSTFNIEFNLSEYLYDGCFSELSQKSLVSALSSSDIARFTIVGAVFLFVTLGIGLYFFREKDI